MYLFKDHIRHDDGSFKEAPRVPLSIGDTGNLSQTQVAKNWRHKKFRYDKIVGRMAKRQEGCAVM